MAAAAVAPRDDVWAFGPIGSPFPDNPVKAMNQPNMYVALWYKHGVPVHGRAWNDGGVLQCSIPYKKAELTGADQLGGQIQVLQYTGNHKKLGFWYEWIKYKDRLEEADHRQIVHCGDSRPILWERPDGALLGYVNNKTEQALFSHDGKVEMLEGGKLDEMWLLTRNTKGGPPNCECEQCHPPPGGAPAAGGEEESSDGGPPDETQEDHSAKENVSPPKRSDAAPEAKPAKAEPKLVMMDEWVDLKEGDPWPDRNLVKALGKSLDTISGENPDQYVALWYKQGEPIMGRIWNNDGKVAASFGWFGNEYREKVGSLQVLVEMGDIVRGFDYEWKPYSEVNSFPFNQNEWIPVYVDNMKLIISPCVINFDGKEILGKADIRNEKASAGFGGKEHELTGPKVHPQQVLCRKAKAGCKFD